MKKEATQTLKVFIMDLLCMTPFYDKYLCKALEKKNPSTWLGAISFHLDIGYFDKFSVQRQPGLLDVVAKLRLRNKSLRQILKVIEYGINLLSLSVRFVLQKPDIIHVQWTPLITKVPVEKWFLKFCKRIGIKLVYTVHNILPHDTGLRHKKTFNEIYHLMDALICHTHEAKTQLLNQFAIPFEKIWVIPHGPMFHDTIKISRFEARVKLNYPEDQKVVLMFGILRPYKGLEFLLQAWAEVSEQCPNSLLVIAGNGDKDYLKRIRQIIDSLKFKHSLETHFKFISEEELPLFHQAADILVYPYQNITQSGALLTGMAFGKPIVATAAGGFKETLSNGETGILVQYGNVEELATALVNLIRRHEERIRLGQAALKELQLNYSWDVIADQTLAGYRSLVASGETNQHIFGEGSLEVK